jgi:hypothetical protein
MRAIIILAGLAMAASWGLTWIEPPFAGQDMSPMTMLAQGVFTLSPAASWQVWVFTGGFVAAGLAALMALNGRGGAVFAMVAGASPLVVLGDAVARSDGLRRDLGLPFPLDFADLAQSWALLEDFIRLGFWAYAGGAGLLLIAGVARVLTRR